MKKKLNILHLRDSSGIYGADRAILTLSKNINKDIFDINLLCMRQSDNRSQKLINKAGQLDIQVNSIDVCCRLDLGAIVKIRNILKERSISLIHSHDYKSDLYGFLSSFNYNIKRVATAHGSTRDSLLKRFYLFWDERVIYRFYDRIIAVSENLKNGLKLKNIAPERIKVIQNGLDLSMLQENSGSEVPIEIPPGNKVFAVIGRLYPDKGHRFFIEALSNVLKRYPKVTALVIGDGPYKKLIAAKIGELGIGSSVFLCGVRSDMKAIYNRIDFLVIPSLTEGLPYVLLEALAHRVPVLATSVGDIPLLIEDGITGFLVPPGNSRALELRMIELLNEQSRVAIMSENGYIKVINRFTADRMVKETERLYLSLIQAD